MKLKSISVKYTGDSKVKDNSPSVIANGFFQKINSPSFFSGLPIQAKLRVGAPDDHYEVEADAMAGRVMRMPEPQVQRKCSSCEDKEKLHRKPLADSISPLVQRSSEGAGAVSSNTEVSITGSVGSGSALPDATRSFMESRFGTDFSGVNIHTGSHAQQLNTQLGARAFTYGNDIFFNRDEYNPTSREGKHLLAHELTHVVQQGGDRRKLQRKIPTLTMLDGEGNPHPLPSQVIEDKNKMEQPFAIKFIGGAETEEVELDNLIKHIKYIIEMPPRRSWTVVIEGKASKEGKEEYNLDLSRKRAESVRDRIKLELDDIEEQLAFETVALGAGEKNQESFWMDRRVFIYLKYEEIILNKRGGIIRDYPSISDANKIDFIKNNSSDPFVNEAFNIAAIPYLFELAKPLPTSKSDFVLNSQEKLYDEICLRAYEIYHRDLAFRQETNKDRDGVPAFRAHSETFILNAGYIYFPYNSADL